MPVIGRAAERNVLAHLLDEAREGISGALVLRGEPGIGKTTLLEYASSAAIDFRVLRIAGFESERDMAFASVHGLLMPFLARREVLPPLQRTTIESAFGLVSAAPADRFMVGLSTLSLLADAAVNRPLLCIIDDAQWIDDESLSALVFAARRLHAERIAMLFGVRATAGQPSPIEGLPSLEITGMDRADATELLRSVASGPVDPGLAERLIADTMGTPLALVELVKGRSPQQLAADVVQRRPLPIGRRLEEYYVQEVRALPLDSQKMLALASADGSRDLMLLGAAARAMGVPLEALEHAEAAGLVSLRAAVHFRHPWCDPRSTPACPGRSAATCTEPSAKRRRTRAIEIATPGTSASPRPHPTNGLQRSSTPLPSEPSNGADTRHPPRSSPELPS